MPTAILAALAMMPMAPAALPFQEKRLKMRIAVAPIESDKEYWFDNWRMPVEFRSALDEKLAQKLLATGRFVVLERAALEAIMQEKAIKEDTTGVPQGGKIIPAQTLVRPKLTNFELNNKGGGLGVNIGGIGRVGGNVSEARAGLNVRLFNVDTSELIASESAEGVAQAQGFKFDGNHRTAYTDFNTFNKTPLGKAMDTAIDKAVNKIVEKLKDQPWSARVADVDGKEVFLSAGEDLGVKVGDEFVVYKKGKEIKDPETGEVLGFRTTKSGRVRVTEVQKKLAIAEVIEGEGFGAGDIVREK